MSICGTVNEVVNFMATPLGNIPSKHIETSYNIEFLYYKELLYYIEFLYYIKFLLYYDILNNLILY